MRMAWKVCSSLLSLAGNCFLAAMAFVPLLLISQTKGPPANTPTNQATNGQPTLTQLQQPRGRLLRHLPSVTSRIAFGICPVGFRLCSLKLTPSSPIAPHTHAQNAVAAFFCFFCCYLASDGGL